MTKTVIGKTANDLQDFITKYNPKRITFDTETDGKFWWRNLRMLCFSIAVSPERAIACTFSDEFIPILSKIFTSDIKIVGHNFPFDLHVLWNHKIKVNLDNWTADTMLMAHTLNEDRKQMHNYELEKLGKAMFRKTPKRRIIALEDYSEGISKYLHKEHGYRDAPSDMLMEYCAKDTMLTYALFNYLSSELVKDKKLLTFYSKFLHPASKALFRMERVGIPINTNRLYKLREEWEEKRDNLHEQLVREIPVGIKRNYINNISLSRSDMVRDFLFRSSLGKKLKPKRKYITLKTQQPSVSQDHLVYFSGDDWIDKYLEWAKVNKLLSTYLKKYERFVTDGRIHPGYSQVFTVSGRTNSSNPNAQNLPKRGHLAKDYRSIFEAPEGYLFVEYDLSQAELRLAAMFSEDTHMVKAFRKGVDIHTLTAGMVVSDDGKASLEHVTPEMRRAAKVINFGLLYGGGAGVLQHTARKDYGIVFTKKESEEFREKFFKLYKGLNRYYQKQELTCRKQGFVESPIYRRRRLPKINSRDAKERSLAYRQAVNAPIQSLSSDLGLMGLIDMLTISKDYGIVPCAFIHDAVWAIVEEENAKEKVLNVLKYLNSFIYYHENFDYPFKVPMFFNCSLGKTLANMEEIA